MDGFFDIAPLLRQQAPDQRQLLAGVVRRVVESIPADIVALRAACDSAALADAGALLHRLRGSVGSLGAARVVAAALALETRLRESDGAGVPPALAQLEQALAATRAAALAWLQTHSVVTPAPGCDDDLARFEQLLAQRNMDACTLLPRLRTRIENECGADVAAQLDEHMAQLDFPAALKLLQDRAPKR